MKSKSFFLFGARGTGKSTLVEGWANPGADLSLNFLDPELAEEIRLNPNRFRVRVLDFLETIGGKGVSVFVDEIQKVPVVLDIVHALLLEKKGKLRFVLTGSSARRLKQSGVNLLAGRAAVYTLWPFCSEELGTAFELSRALERGLLPESYLARGEDEYKEFLKAYCYTYLEKEIQQEQWVRKLEPFQRFLPIAAQMNGQVVNRANIAGEVGVDDMTVQNYFEILEDTMMGFFLPSFHRSVRKQQREAPKFYWVDMGLKRALEKKLDVPIHPRTSDYGNAFEHFILLEIKKRIEYRRLQWSLYYAQTRDGVEIDIVIERGGLPDVQVEIKSKDKVAEADARSLNQFGRDLDSKAERYLISRDPVSQKFGSTKALPWQKFFNEVGLALEPPKA